MKRSGSLGGARRELAAAVNFGISQGAAHTGLGEHLSVRGRALHVKCGL